MKVIEARDRVGGRVHTVPFGHHGDQAISTDLGAAWIHGIGPGAYGDPKWEAQLNPIYEIAQKHHIATVKTWEGDRDPSKQEAYWHFGDLASPEIFKILADMEKYLEDLQTRRDLVL